MDKSQIIITAVLFLGCVIFAIIIYILMAKKKDRNFDALMKVARPDTGHRISNPFQAKGEKAKPADEDIAGITEAKRKEYKKKTNQPSQEERYYHAGLLTLQDQTRFKRLRVVVPIVISLILAIVGYFIADFRGAAFGVLIGVLGGFSIPGFLLDFKIAKRSEEIMYYLPLVIEQIAIGVSSSLDIGPCLQRVVQMADERDSHNVVTELIYHAERYIKTGVSLEEALNEVGTKSGHTELKHAFMALSQVAKHGGEITHQLQELANAVASQRETMIEARIKKLELKATGPVAMVFAGFMMTLLSGLLIKIKESF